MRRILFIVLTIAAIFELKAIDPQTTIYLYRNDGAFDAFRVGQVDSITYSKTDLDGVLHDHYVTQEIWSNNTVNRVPLSAIENVGFEQPDIIVSSDLFPFTASHDSYIVEADTLSFRMSGVTPNNMRPNKGNIVVAESDCQSFANGILAKVKSIEIEADGSYYFQCERASFDDIYEQIVFYGSGESDEEIPGQENAPNRISKEFNKEIWDKTFEGTIEKLGGTKYYANDKATCEIKVCKTLGTPLYASITLKNTFTGNVSLDFSAEKDYEPEPVQIGKTLKVGRISFPHPLLANLIWLEPQIKFMGYFKAHGELDIDFGAHLNRTDAVNLTYSNKEWSISHTPTMDAAVDSAALSMKGYVEVGLIPDILLALNGSATGIGITGKVGIKQTLDLTLDAKECFDTSVYEGIKDTHTDTWLKYSTSIFVQSGLFDKDTPRKSYELLDREKMLFSKYIFPKFGTASYQQLSNGIHLLKVDAERDVLCPLRLGLRLYDDNDNFVTASTDTLAYNGKNAATYAFTFKDIDLANTYKAYPMIYLGSLTLRATPAYTVNKCPAKIESMELVEAYYDRNDTYAPNTMHYTINAVLTDDLPADATEWGIAIGTNLYPFEALATEGTKHFLTGVPDGTTYGAGFRIDYYNYVFEVDRTARAYVKRVNPDGKETIMYSDLFSTTLRYDTPPSMEYSDASLKSTTLLSNYYNSSGQFVQQFKSVASYTMTLNGAFWLNYIDGAVDGQYSLSNNPIWQPTYDGVWNTEWETTYLSTDNIDHSNWHKLHLRYTGRVVESDRLNWISSGGHISRVSITPSLNPAVNYTNYAPAGFENTREVKVGKGHIPTECIELTEIYSKGVALDDTEVYRVNE